FPLLRVHDFVLVVPGAPRIPTLFPYTTLFRSLVLLVTLAFVLAAAAGLVLPTALGRIVDLAASPTSDDADVWRLGAWMAAGALVDRKSTRLNSSHVKISYAVFCLKKKINNGTT